MYYRDKQTVLSSYSSITLFTVLIVFSILSPVYTLTHQEPTQSLEDRQYQKLTQQQKTLEDDINNLLSDMINVQKNVSKTTKSSEKVLLLEQAIISERQRVFDIQNQIIPPFSLSKTACLQLTNQQKIDLLDNITETKNQLTQLQQQIFVAPKCDKIKALEKDTLKQITLLESLQNTILTQCQSKSILTPTIYQTNIYADGWILGDQHIDDLVEEYYQRNIRYHNITNCPLERPFFNGEDCILCLSPYPVFDILTKQCTTCPEGQEPDSKTRKCDWQPHYTNFSSVENWATQGAPMPTPNRKLVPCPPQRAYYNGRNCQACVLPFYWSIRKNACVQCPIDRVFDLNNKKCVRPQKYQLTLLQGTRWVTNDCNLTRIVQNRIKILQLNKTKEYYKYCPISQPYYDGVTCISCPRQFNIDTRKCTTSPSTQKIYNQNMRCYMQKQYNMQTNPKASSYTTKYPLKDSITPNCRKAKPYWDGLACIDCLRPFTIFNLETKKCGVCQPMEYYNRTQHKCLPRDKIYISSYDKHLMATPRMSIQDYHEQIHHIITDNPQAVILPCPDQQYSNYKKCIVCKHEQYFNVQTKKCDNCDGTLNQTTNLCSQRAYLYTYFNTDSIPRIIQMGNRTVEKQNATINEMLKIHKNANICPKTKPFSNKKQCLNCTKQSFNYTSLKCVPLQCVSLSTPFYNNVTQRCQQCPDGMMYNEIFKSCQPIRYVTNTNAIYFYIQQDNYTKAALEDEIYELEQNHTVIPCEASHPYFNGKKCIDCAITRNVEQIEEHKPYFNLKSLECQGCQNFDNKTHRCLDDKKPKKCSYPTPVLNSRGECQACPQGTSWVQGQCKPLDCQQPLVFNEQTNTCQQCQNGTYWIRSIRQCGQCQGETTYNQQTFACESQNCTNGQIFNQQTGECQQWVTNVQAMGDNYIQSGQGTLENYKNQIEQKKRENEDIRVCPAQAPYFSSDYQCIACNGENRYFNLQTRKCVECRDYDAQNKQCNDDIPRFDMNIQDFYGTIFG